MLATKTLHDDTKLSLALTTPGHVTATVSIIATLLSQSTYMVTYSCKLVSCNSVRISLFSVATFAAVHPRRSVNSHRLTDSNKSPIMSTLARPSRAMFGSVIQSISRCKQLSRLIANMACVVKDIHDLPGLHPPIGNWNALLLTRR